MKTKDKTEPVQEPQQEGAGPEVEKRVIWTKPHPDAVYQTAADAMDSTGNKILASAMRALAKAEANGIDTILEPADVVAWLAGMAADITWLQDHIATYYDHQPYPYTRKRLQQDIPALVPEHQRKQCRWCGDWFLPQRSTGVYCQGGRCRQAAHEERRRVR